MKIKELTEVTAIAQYLARIGAEARSLNTAVVKMSVGKYWEDVAIIKFSRSGEIDCYDERYKPTDVEKQAIMKEILDRGIEWPNIKPIQNIINAPSMIKDANQKNLFEFRNSDNQIIMVQVRKDKADGDKYYVPWTYWDDDEWRCCEPDGPLPLYNAERIKENSTVFIHEGAKAAKYVQWMVDGETQEARQALAEHPWGNELIGAAHVGWVGGALNPRRTDWSILRKSGVKRAYIIADNDRPGKSAVAKISNELYCLTFALFFTDEFPISFDMADKFPEKMFSNGEGERVYIGSTFRSHLAPATWATNKLIVGKGRPSFYLREHFKNMWSYIEDADLFICNEMPDIIRPAVILNKVLAPYSDVDDTCKLIVKSQQERTVKLCYRPDSTDLLIVSKDNVSINTYVKPDIKTKKGNYQPFIDFINYMFINKDERDEIYRWIATLVAKPEVRMGYGILLVSEKQGIGKTTLGSRILAPLVGWNNVSFPREADIKSEFNGWLANKRLAIVNEIYSGHSWRAYHSLKTAITDRDVSVNVKYQRQYEIENWCHVFACSNSRRAMKMENDDRRWFYPELTECIWPKEKFTELNAWIDNGGITYIKYWAENYGKYIMANERAPITYMKMELIEGSRSEAQAEAAALAEALNDYEKPAGLTMSEIIRFVRSSCQWKIFDQDYELRKSMKDYNCYTWSERIKIGGRLQYIIVNQKIYENAIKMERLDAISYIRQNIVRPDEILQTNM